MSESRPIRVLVIDDSAYSRRAITGILKRSPLAEVVGWAADGEEALRKVIELEPDLITLDLEMPRMDGFTFLRVVMAKCPAPVIVISGRSGHPDVFKALELGAVDFVAKPAPRACPSLDGIEQELLRKVHGLRELRIDKLRARIEKAPQVVPRGEESGDAPPVVVIGASTGGPAALMQIFAAFGEPPAAAFLVAQHMPRDFTRSFAERLGRLTLLRAREAQGGEEPRAGEVLVAPGGSHLELEAQGGRPRTRLLPQEEHDRYAPRIDRLFESAAKQYGPRVLGVVLTGMGSDGRRGAAAIQAAGGRVIVESEETAVVFGMPHQVIREGAADAVLPLHAIAEAIRSGGPEPAPRSGVERHE